VVSGVVSYCVFFRLFEVEEVDGWLDVMVVGLIWCCILVWVLVRVGCYC